MVENCHLQRCQLTGEFFTFQQDNAPAHHARETVEMLSREMPDFILPLQWLPNSPDLNPVDYEIWGRLQERVYRSRIRDVNHFDHVTTTSTTVTSCSVGVPQGSVLVPLLFSIYTSPLATIAEVYNVLQQQYVDDT